MQQKTQPLVRVTGQSRKLSLESEVIPYRYDTVKTVADVTNITNGMKII